MLISKKNFLFFSSTFFYLIFICFFSGMGLLSVIVYSIYGISIIYACLFASKNALAPSSIFIYFYMLFLGIGILILLQRKYSFRMDGIFYISEGILAFMIGTLVSTNKKTKIKSIIPQNINYKAMMLYSKIICGIGIASGFYYLMRNLKYIMANYENNRVSAQSGNGFLMYFMSMVIPCGIMMFECYLNGQKKKSIWIYIGIGATIMVLSGSRSRLIELILGLVLVYNQKKKVKPRTVVKLGIVCFLLVSVLGAFRVLLSGETRSTFNKLFGVIYANDINLNYVFKTFPQKVPFQHGSTYFMNFAMLLPGSQPDFTLWLKSITGVSYSGGGLTPSIIGESYLNFGNAGIIGVLFLLGLIFKRIDINIKYTKNYLPHIILILYLCKSVTGGLANIFLRLIFFEGIVLFVCFLSKTKRVGHHGF